MRVEEPPTANAAPVSLHGIRHIVWDWNGTLLDDVRLCTELINGVMRRRGMRTITVEEHRDRFDFPVIRYYERLGFDLEEESFDDLSVEFIDGYEERRDECVLHDGARELLEAVHSRGLSQSILSAYRQETLDDLIDQMGMRAFFSHVVGQEGIRGESKVERARRKFAGMACAPHEVLVVGDTGHDCEVAQQVGAACILVSHGHHSAERLRTWEVPVVGSLQDLHSRWFGRQ